MKKSILIVLAMFIYSAAVVAQGQKAELVFGEMPGIDQAKFSGYKPFRILGSDKNNIYVSYSSGSLKPSKIILCLDFNTLKQKAQTEIGNYTINGTEVKFRSCSFSDGKIIVRSIGTNKSTQNIEVYQSTLNTGTLQMNNDGKLIYSTDQKKIRDISISTSADGSKSIFYYNMGFENAKVPVMITLFDNKTNTQLWQKKFIPETQSIMDQGYSVSNSGKIYHFAKRYKKGSGTFPVEEVNGKPNYDIAITVISDATSEPKNIVYVQTDKYIKKFEVEYDGSDRPSVIAFCSNEAKGPCDGISIMTVNAQGDAFDVKPYQSFPGGYTVDVKAHQSFPGANTIEKDNLNVMVRNVNDITLTTERQETEDAVVTGGVTYFEDMTILRTGENGKIKWKAIVPKNQESTGASVASGDPYSYFPFSWNKQSHLIYNDNPENISLTDNLKKYRGKNGETVLATVDEDGKVTKQLLTKDNGNMVISPRYCVASEDNWVLLVGEKNAQFQFSKLTFK